VTVSIPRMGLSQIVVTGSAARLGRRVVMTETPQDNANPANPSKRSRRRWRTWPAVGIPRSIGRTGWR